MGFAREQGIVAPYFIKLEGEITVSVIGIVSKIDTTGRPNPPPPHSGFKTAKTPFGNGHVFALSLGGSDSRKNIVPQWEQWQQTGAWRRFEVDCEAFNGQIFRCDILYNPAASQQYDLLWAAFQKDRLIAWSDPRLPTHFRVRVFARADLGSYDGISNEAQLDAALSALDKKKEQLDSGWLDHVDMPLQDRAYWQEQTIGTLLDDMYDDFQDEEELRATGAGKKLDRAISFTGFVLHPDTIPDLQKQLEEYNGFTATEIAGVKADRMLRATHKWTEKKVKDTRAEYAKMHSPGGKRHKKSRSDLSEFGLPSARDLRRMGILPPKTN